MDFPSFDRKFATFRNPIVFERPYIINLKPTRSGRRQSTKNKQKIGQLQKRLIKRQAIYMAYENRELR